MLARAVRSNGTGFHLWTPGVQLGPPRFFERFVVRGNEGFLKRVLGFMFERSTQRSFAEALEIPVAFILRWFHGWAQSAVRS